MNKINILIITLVIFALLFSGCVEKPVTINADNSNTKQLIQNILNITKDANKHISIINIIQNKNVSFNP